MNIPTDKVGHFVVGGLGAGGAAFVGLLAKLAPAWWPLLAIVAAASAGIARELWQASTHRGTADARDAWATAMGGCAVAVGLQWGQPMAWLYGGLVVACLWGASRPPAPSVVAQAAARAEGGPEPGPRP
jgi:hypothetical protein